MNEPLKTCTQCKETKPLKRFYKCSPKYYRAACMECHKKVVNAGYVKRGSVEVQQSEGKKTP